MTRLEDSDDLDRLIRTGLREHVADVEAGDALLHRIRSSSQPPLARRRGSLVLAVAAAAILVVGAVWLVWSGPPEESVMTGGVDDPTEDAGDGVTSTSTTTTTPTTGPGVAAPLPDRAVVARSIDDGRIVDLLLVDLADGSTIATLASFDNRDCVEAACYRSIAGTAVTGALDLLVETCCEPAGGHVERWSDLDPDSGAVGETAPIASGFHPAVDPSFDRVAVVGLTAVIVREVDGGQTDTIDILSAGHAAGNELPTGLAWAPDGTRLAVTLDSPEGTRLVVVAPDAAHLDEGRTIEQTELASVQAWTTGRLWALDRDGFVVAIDPESGDLVRFDTQAREVVTDRSGTHLYVLTTEGLWRADPRAQGADGLLTGQSPLVAASEGALLAASVFPSAPCVVEGPLEVDVPDVVGLVLEEATARLESAGLQVIGTGVPAGDPVDQGVVTAQEPPAGTAVPERACVGLRTEER